MGVLSQKCVKQFPTDPDELLIWGNLTDESWDFFMHNETNWWLDSGGQYALCGNSSGAGKCPYGYDCLAGELQTEYSRLSMIDFTQAMAQIRITATRVLTTSRTLSSARSG